MSAIIRYILCASILTTSISLKPAWKIVKFSANGIGLAAATLYTADLLRNYTKYPDPTFAISATDKDVDSLTSPLQKAFAAFSRKLETSKTFKEFEIERKTMTRPVLQFFDQHATPVYKATSKNFNAGLNSVLKTIQPHATTLHLKLYPKQTDCPCINGFNECPAHKVDFGNAILINAEKIIRSKVK